MTDCETCPHHSGIEAELKAIVELINEKETRVGGEVKKLCLLLEERKELTNVRINQMKEEVVLARADMERRLEGMNEFRAQLTSQATLFATRAELKTEAEKLDLKLVPLVKASLTSEGASRWSDYLIMALISGAIVALAKLIHL
jgi:hypothetical protein